MGEWLPSGVGVRVGWAEGNCDGWAEGIKLGDSDPTTSTVG